MSREPMDELIGRLRESYHRPPPTPRDEMWASIAERLDAPGEEVVSIEQARELRAARSYRPLGLVAAAAAVLVLGVGIGRMTVPVSTVETGSYGEADPEVMRAAALDHLGRTESLLTLVRADASSGRVDPVVGTWAKSLLTQTRLLLDRGEGDPAMRALLEDLELVLVQIVGVSETDALDEGRARSELTLTLEGMDEREVLSRIQAVVPAGAGLAGT